MRSQEPPRGNPTDAGPDSTEPAEIVTGGRSAWRLLLPLGVVELALLVTLGWWPGATFPWIGLGLFGGAFVAYAVAAVATRRGSGGGALIWALAVAMRLALLPLTPELSDDVYRYLWDGHVQLSGVNPYQHAPAAPELAELRTDYHDLINNPTVPTIYPPLAQAAFLLIALMGSSLIGAKLLWLTCDLGAGWILGRIARATGRDERLVRVLYLWSPLLVVETAWSGHLEPLGLLALSAAMWSAQRASPTPSDSTGPSASVAAGSSLALSALTKFAPAAALPALVRRLGWRSLAGFVATGLVLYAPFAISGADLFAGLRTYSEHWWFMKGPFGALEAVFGDPMNARYSAAAIVVAVIAWTAYARYGLDRALLWVLGAGMILTPTLHPWYVLWMLPMAALRTSRPWLLLSGLAFIGYFGLGSYQQTGDWVQPGLARAFMWGPFLALLLYEATRFRRAHPEEVPRVAKRG